MILAVELTISEMIVPADPDALRGSGVDAGVLPRDMADHLRVTEVFPVAPTVAGPELPVRVVGGGRCVWAAAIAGWSRPIRCVVEGNPPRGVLAVPLGEVLEPRPTELTHSAAFTQPLGMELRVEVENQLIRLAERLSARGLRSFSRIADVRWPRPDLAHVFAPNGEGEAAVLGPELWRVFAELAERGISLRSWDGRVLL
jgi:hypothetical protein